MSRQSRASLLHLHQVAFPLLNFAPGIIRVPDGIRVVNVDLTVQLEQLAFLVQMSAAE